MRGDDLKATLFGLCATILLAATMVVAGLKAGITPGASTLVVLVAWSAFRSSIEGTSGRRFLMLAQVAGSSGMAVVSGVIFTAPLLQALHLNLAQTAVRSAYNNTPSLEKLPVPNLKEIPWIEAQELIKTYYGEFPGVNPFVMMIFTFAGVLIGYGFVGISTKKFLSDPTLPAPEAHACNTMISASAESGAEKPALGISLVLSTVSSFFLPLLKTFNIASDITIYARKFGVEGKQRAFALVLPFDPVYFGIGGLLTLSTAIVTVAGASVRLLGDLSIAPLQGQWAERFPESTMRWVGGGAMTVAIVFSLVKFMNPRVASDGDQGDERLLDIPRIWVNSLLGCIAIGCILLGGGIFSVDSFDPVYAILMILTIIIMASLMVTLGAILSLQIGSSASPVSGTVFVTTLVVCLVSVAYRSISKTTVPALDVVPVITYMLITGCVAVSTANDSSQDYKTMQLGGIPPHEGFISQITGLIGGAVVVPLSFWLAHTVYGLGTVRLPAPQGEVFATLIDGILINKQVPVGPVLVGLVLGVFAVGIEVFSAKRGLMLPAMAFSVGIYLPPDLGVGILFGAGARFIGEQVYASRTGKKERTYESILAAAGMITGAASKDLVLGLLVLATFKLPDTAPATWKSTLIAGFGVIYLNWMLFHNSAHGIPEVTAQPDAPEAQLSTAKSASILSIGNKEVAMPLQRADVEMS